MIKTIMRKIANVIAVILLITEITPVYMYAQTVLEVPESLSWKEGTLATAKWENVAGADYYEIKVEVFSGDESLGTANTGTAETEVDLQSQIRSLVSDRVDSVEVRFAVMAKNIETGARSNYSEYSERKNYSLTAITTLPTPEDISLSENGVVSFREVEGADHYLVTWSIEGSSFGGVTDTKRDADFRDGYVYLDVSERMKKDYIGRGYIGQKVLFFVEVEAVSAEGRSGLPGKSNYIDYLINSSLTTPQYVSFKKKGNKYLFEFRDPDEVDSYEFELFMKKYKTRDPEFVREEEFNEDGTIVKPNLDILSVDPVKYFGFTEKEDGVKEIDLLDILRFYYFDHWEPSPDFPADIGVRVRARKGDDISAYSEQLIIKDFYEEPLIPEIVSPKLRYHDGKCMLSFNAVPGAEGYQVEFHITAKGVGAGFSNRYGASDIVVSKNGICEIDITDVYDTECHLQAAEGQLMLFSISVRAYGDTEKYEIGPYSKESNYLRVYPYGSLVEQIRLSPREPVVAVGNSIYVGLTVSPDNGYYEKTDWMTDGNNVIALDQGGMVTGLAVGRANVKATVDRAVFDSVSVNVYEVRSNIEDESEKDRVRKQAGDIIDNIANGVKTDLSKTDISANDIDALRRDICEGVKNRNRFNTDILKISLSYNDVRRDINALEKALGVSISENIVSENSTASANGVVSGNSRNTTSEERLDGDAEVKTGRIFFAGAFDLKLDMYHTDLKGTDHHIGNIEKTEDEVTFTAPMPELSADLERKGNSYMLLGVRGGVVTRMPLSVNADGTFTTKTDTFSRCVLLVVIDESKKDEGDKGNVEESGGTGDKGNAEEGGGTGNKGNAEEGGGTGDKENSGTEGIGQDETNNPGTGNGNGDKKYTVPEIFRDPLNPDNITLNLVEKQKYTLTDAACVRGMPYKLEISGNMIAKISRKGVIKAKKEGSMSARIISGKKTLTLRINVLKPSFLKKKLSVKIGQFVDLGFDSKGLAVTYSVPPKKSAVLSVSEDGTVYGKTRGSAAVTALVNGRKYKIRVKVMP